MMIKEVSPLFVTNKRIRLVYLPNALNTVSYAKISAQKVIKKVFKNSFWPRIFIISHTFNVYSLKTGL